MQSFIVAALCIACVVAVGNAAAITSGNLTFFKSRHFYMFSTLKLRTKPAGLHPITDSVSFQFTPLFTQLESEASSGDLQGAASTLQETMDLSNQLLSNTDDQDARAIIMQVQSVIEPQLTKINAGESSAEDLENLVGDLSLALREVGGWFAGTAIGLGNAAAQGVGGLVKGAENGLKNGLEDGNILKGLLNGVTGGVSGAAHGITNGAGKGFSNGFGAVLSG